MVVYLYASYEAHLNVPPAPSLRSTLLNPYQPTAPGCAAERIDRFNGVQVNHLGDKMSGLLACRQLQVSGEDGENRFSKMFCLRPRYHLMALHYDRASFNWQGNFLTTLHCRLLECSPTGGVGLVGGGRRLGIVSHGGEQTDYRWRPGHCDK